MNCFRKETFLLHRENAGCKRKMEDAAGKDSGRNSVAVSASRAQMEG